MEDTELRGVCLWCFGYYACAEWCNKPDDKNKDGSEKALEISPDDPAFDKSQHNPAIWRHLKDGTCCKDTL